MKEKIQKNRKKAIIIILIIAIIATVTCIIATRITNHETIQESKQGATQAEVKEITLENNEHMHIETDAKGNKVPVPNGYKGSSVAGENEISTGYVIYEGEQAVTSSNVDTARKTRNQYVWVPVPDATKMYGIDANGKMWGKLYTFSDTEGDSVTGTSPNNWSETEDGVMQISKNGVREPDVIIEYGTDTGDTDSVLEMESLDARSSHEFLMQIERELVQAIKSIEKYGGFYIGRYETGSLSKSVPKIVKYETDIADQTWYTMYRKCKLLAGDNQHVSTGILWSCEWDRTLMWLIESGNKTKAQVAKDSISWGNYNNVQIEYIDAKGTKQTKKAYSSKTIPTGSAEQTKANNIYDLAGNMVERTMEVLYGSRRNRGGRYTSSSMNDPAWKSFGMGPDYRAASFGCRTALYIEI